MPNCSYMLLCNYMENQEHPDICWSHLYLFTWIVKQTKFIFSLFVSVKFPRKIFDKKKNQHPPPSFSSLRSLTYSLHEMRGTGIKTSKPRGIKTIEWEDQPTKIEQVRKSETTVRERGKVKEIVGLGDWRGRGSELGGGKEGVSERSRGTGRDAEWRKEKRREENSKREEAGREGKNRLGDWCLVLM